MHTDNEDLKIPEEIRRLISGAKRHHYVSEFLLRRFSIDPHDERPQIYRLEVTMGTIATSSTRDCAVIQHYNRLSDWPLPSMRTPQAWWGCSRMAPTMQP